MPEMDGLTLFEEVTSVRPSLPMILMSGRPHHGSACRFLAKPFTQDSLLACIAHTVGPIAGAKGRDHATHGV
jgi:DNA-binding NtrC family response regulator